MTQFAVITIEIPLPDEADDKDAEGLGELVAFLALQENADSLVGAKPVGKVIDTHLRRGDSVGFTRARAILDANSNDLAGPERGEFSVMRPRR